MSENGKARKANRLAPLQIRDLLNWLEAHWPTIESTRPSLAEAVAHYNGRLPVGMKPATVGNLRGAIAELGRAWPTSHAAAAARRNAGAEKRLALLALEVRRVIGWVTQARNKLWIDNIDPFEFSPEFEALFPPPGRPDPIETQTELPLARAAEADESDRPATTAAP